LIEDVGHGERTEMKAFRLRAFVRSVSVAVLCVVLAGCGGRGEERTPAEEQPQEEPQAAAQQPAEQPPTTEQMVEEPVTQPPQQLQPTVVRESATSEYGFYTIQLSAWRTGAKAQSQARYYREHGLEAYVERAELPGMGTWYRVRVGKYPSLSMASRAARAIVDIPFDQVWMDNYRGEEPPRR